MVCASTALMANPLMSVPGATKVTYSSAGSIMPNKAPTKKMPHWSTRTMRHQPRQRAVFAASGSKMNPVEASCTFSPPTAPAICPTRLPMP
jgi:hypothetical protein